MDSHKHLRGTILVLLAGICFSSLSILAVKLNELDIGAWTQMLARLLGASLVFTAVASMTPRAPQLARPPISINVFLINGFFIFAGGTTYLLSLSLGTPATKAILLAFLSPIYTILFGVVFLHEKVTYRKIVAVVLGIMGVALTMQFWDTKSLATIHKGDIFALINGLFTAGIIIIGRYTGSSLVGLPPSLVLSWTNLFALMWLTMLGVLALLFWDADYVVSSIATLVDQNGRVYLVGLAILSTILPFGFLYAGLRYISSSSASVLLLIEPVSLFVLAALLLHTPISIWHLLGGAAIIGAAYLASTSPATKAVELAS